MLKYKFKVFILFVLLLFPICVKAQVRNVSTYKTLIYGDYETRLLNLVNQEREKVGVQPLVLDSNLVQASRQRAVEISVRYDAGHLRPDGRDWSTVIGDYGVSGSHFGENIAFWAGSATPEAIFDLWKNSTPHLNNILNPDYSSLGLGIVESSNGYRYYVQNFGNSVSSTYTPSAGVNKVGNSYNLRFEDSLAVDVEPSSLDDIYLAINDDYNINFIVKTKNYSSYPEYVELMLHEWTSSNPDVVSVNNTNLHVNNIGSSKISTTFNNQEYSFDVIVGVGDDTNDNDESFKGMLQITTAFNSSAEEILIDDRKEYLLNKVVNSNVTQTIGNGDIINKSPLDIKLCVNKDCTNYLKPIKYVSDDEEIAYFTQDNFIFNKSGQTNITAIFENGISVKIPVNVYYFKFNNNEYNIRVNEVANTKTNPVFDIVDYNSEDQTIATIDQQGVITGIKEGTTFVNAIKDNSLFARAKVNVVNDKSISIEIDQYNAQLVLGEELDLKVTVKPEDTKVEFSSNNTSVATVDGNGKVLAVGCGNAVITVTAASEHKDVNIVVVENENTPTIIDIDKSSVELFELETVKINATVSPIQALTWYSDNDDIASVDNDGLITAIKNGSTTIHVVSEDGCKKSISVVVKLRESTETNISVDKSRVELLIGGTEKINATVSPAQKLTWTSQNSSIASVDNNGLITAIKDGETIIDVVSEDGVRVSINVVVKFKEIPITDIVLDRDNITLTNGDSTTIKATINPENTTQSLDLIWKSSNTSVATVNESGLITAVGYGIAQITVTSVNGVSKVIEVVVNNKIIPISKIEVDKDNVTLDSGKSTTVNASIYPLDTTDNKELSWSSSNEDIVTVDNNGKITAISPGNAIITVTAVNGVSTTINVSVLGGAITQIKLNHNNLLLRDDFVLDVVGYEPSGVLLDKNDLKWTSSDTSVVIVENGVLIPVGMGEATITVFYADVYDECHVIVDDKTAIKSFGNIIDRQDPSNCIDSVLINDTLQLAFILNEELRGLSKYDNYKVKWEVNENLVIADNGDVIAVKPGLGYIRAYYGLYSVTRYFNVYKIDIEKDRDTIDIGESVKIKVIVTSPDATSNRAHFELSNYNIASISDDGVLVGKQAGNVTVYVYSIDRKVFKSITIKIIDNNKNNDNNNNNENNNNNNNQGQSKPSYVVNKPAYNNGNTNSKDNNSTNSNGSVENKFDVVFDQDTFTIENENGKAVLKMDDITVSGNNISLSANEELIALYDIHYLVGSNSTFTDPSFTVKIPLKIDKSKYDSIYVAYILNGKVEEIVNSSISGDYVELKTNHFSHYAIIGTKSSTKDDNKTTDNSNKTENKNNNSEKTNKSKVNSKLIIFISVFIIIWIILFTIINKFITKFYKKKKND